MFTATKLTAARARVNDTLRAATQRHVENAVPKLQPAQRRYLAQAMTPALMDAAIKRYGSENIDRFLTDASKAEAE